MFENPRSGRQARNFTTHVTKILDLNSSCEQIFSRKLTFGAPDSETTWTTTNFYVSALLVVKVSWSSTLVGSWNNDDHDSNGKEIGKKTIRLDLQKQQLCMRITLLCHLSLPSLHDNDMKLPNFTFCGRREHKTATLFLFFWTLIQSFRIQLQKNSPTFDELNEMEHTRYSLKQREFSF